MVKRDNFHRWGGMVEAGLLLALGLFMVSFSYGGHYWALLNPKFQWLTAGAGYGLIALGTGAFFFPDRYPRTGRMAVFTLLLGLLVYCDRAVLPAGSVGASTPAPAPESEMQAETRLVWQGREYVKINLGELFILADEGPDAVGDRRFVLQGMAYRLAGPENITRFLLLRTAVSCCLADAVGLGFQVDGPLPDQVKDGEWVRVFGRLAPLPQPVDEIVPPALKGVFQTVLNENRRIEAERILPVLPPATPFMFDFRDQEPYAY